MYTNLYLKSKILIHVPTNDLKLQTMTENRQIRPIVREGAPQRHNSNRQTVTNIWSGEPEGAQHQDILPN
jgi:hypothetical protein